MKKYEINKNEFDKIDSLIENVPKNVIVKHSLKQKHAKVLFKNENAFLVDTPYEPNEPYCFGNDIKSIIELLKQLPDLKDFSCNDFSEKEVVENYEKVFKQKISAHPNDTFVYKNRNQNLKSSAKIFTSRDLNLLKDASEYFDWFGFLCLEEMLEKSIITGIVENDELTSVAYASAFSGNYVDIGVRTRKEFRKKGYATESAQKIIEEVLNLGRIPVWNVMRNNTPSVKIAENLGFEKSGTTLIYW